MVAAPKSSPAPSSRRRPRKKVALLVETSNAYSRGLLNGIMAYMRRHESWSVYLREHGRGDDPPRWLRRWRGDGVIARIENDRIASAVLDSGLHAVDVSGAVGRGPEHRNRPRPGNHRHVRSRVVPIRSNAAANPDAPPAAGSQQPCFNCLAACGDAYPNANLAPHVRPKPRARPTRAAEMVAPTSTPAVRGSA